MSLIKNSILNLSGFAIPTIIAIPALGILARLIGVESFGIFTLAFALIGYASIFDAGISRAVIREVSLYRNDYNEQCNIVATASVVVVGLGFLAAGALILGAYKVTQLLNVSLENFEDTILSFKILAFIIPFYLLNQIWLGYLEGLERFGNINVQRIITSSTLAVLPVVFCYVRPTLEYAIIGLACGRVLSLLITAIICKAIIFDSWLRFNIATFNRLITFGGWLTISNIISPMMVYFDRFIISHIMGASKIAFYTAPSEGVSRLINIPYALARALFPKLSYCSDRKERKKLEAQSYLLISITCLPIVIIGLIFSSFIMSHWMGIAYAGDAATVLKILLIGFYFNSLAQIPYSLLQSQGKSKVTALIHLAEVVPYMLLLFTLTVHFGIIGTAVSWSIRMLGDLLVLFFISRKI